MEDMRRICVSPVQNISAHLLASESVETRLVMIMCFTYLHHVRLMSFVCRLKNFAL
jgi:hypothetical protein